MKNNYVPFKIVMRMSSIAREFEDPSAYSAIANLLQMFRIPSLTTFINLRDEVSL
jgi:hypothetical protein